MGCFLGCFGRRKNRRLQKRRESFQPRLNRISEGSTEENQLKLKVPTVKEVPKVTDWSAKDDHFKILTVKNPNVEEVPQISVIPTTDTCDKAKESYSSSPTCKRVTFDSNVKTYEHIVVEESISLEEKPLKSQCSYEGSDITSNSSESYPSNHRYQNCRESDDDEEDNVTDCDESDLDDEEDDGLLHEDYYNDIDNYEDKLQNWDKEVYTEEIADNVMEIEKIKEKPNGNARDRSGYVNSVLNPIENLTQWKALKSKERTTTTKTQISHQEHKPKASSFSLDPQVDELSSSLSLKPKPRDDIKKQRTQEVAVDASLSTWLTTSSGCSSVSINTCTNSKPIRSHDERPILCALTAEEIKQFSPSNSPRKSPRRSPESPIIGTVGGYWNNQSMIIRKNKVV